MTHLKNCSRGLQIHQYKRANTSPWQRAICSTPGSNPYGRQNCPLDSISSLSTTFTSAAGCRITAGASTAIQFSADMLVPPKFGVYTIYFAGSPRAPLIIKRMSTVKRIYASYIFLIAFLAAVVYLLNYPPTRIVGKPSQPCVLAAATITSDCSDTVVAPFRIEVDTRREAGYLLALTLVALSSYGCLARAPHGAQK